MQGLPVPVLIAALALAGGTARAAEPPIRISVPACPSAPFSVEAFLGSLEVELAGHAPACCLLDPTPAPGVPGLLVTLAIAPCDASATAVDVRVQDPARAAAAERKVELADIAAEARPRALALAVAELVHSVSQPPAPPALAPPPAAPARPQLPTRFVSGTLELEAHPGNNLLLWGVAASLGVARGRWQAALDLEGLTGDPSVPLGDVETRLFAATLTAGPRFSLGRLVVDVGAAGRFGWCWMSGHTSDPGATPGGGSAPVASVGGRIGILLPTAARVSHLRALLEGGGTIHGLDATVNGASTAGLAGGYFLIGLGFGENR